MRVLSMVHQADAGPGVFAERIAAEGAEHDTWLIGDEPDPPAPVDHYDAVMTFGGAMNVEESERHAWIAVELEVLKGLLDRGTPLVGACLGAQLLCAAAGGEVRRMAEPEIGWFDTGLTAEGRADPVLGGCPSPFEAFQWHSFECVPPPGTKVLASSPLCGVQAFRIGSALGIQFHAEVSEPDAMWWIDDWRSDPDAVRIGLDHEALRAETRQKIPAWNEFGRELCGRFLESLATARA